MYSLHDVPTPNGHAVAEQIMRVSAVLTIIAFGVIVAGLTTGCVTTRPQTFDDIHPPYSQTDMNPMPAWQNAPDEPDIALLDHALNIDDARDKVGFYIVERVRTNTPPMPAEDLERMIAQRLAQHNVSKVRELYKTHVLDYHFGWRLVQKVSPRNVAGLLRQIEWLKALRMTAKATGDLPMEHALDTEIELNTTLLRNLRLAKVGYHRNNIPTPPNY